MKKTFTSLKIVLFIGVIALFSCQQEEITTPSITEEEINADGTFQNEANGNASADTTITVTDCNLNGWVKQPIGNSSLGFVNGPDTPPIGSGSLKFYVPAGGIFWPGDFVRFRNGEYSGTKLSTLTELSFDTYIEARDTITDIHFLVVLSDINGDGAAEHNLVFDPQYQNSNFIKGTMPDQGFSQVHEWQRWDAL